MSADTIPARANGQTINEVWFNIIRAALGGDFVPRNATGVATEVGGSLGSADLPWLKLFLGAAASQISIEEDSGSLILKVGGSEKVRISASEFRFVLSGVTKALIDTNGFSRLHLSPPNWGISAGDSESFVDSSGSTVNVTNLVASISASGKPIKAILVPAVSGSYIETTRNAAAGSGAVFTIQRRLNSGSYSTVGGWTLQGAFTGATGALLQIPPSSCQFVDVSPPAGNLDYRIQANSGLGTLRVIGAKLFLEESG